MNDPRFRLVEVDEPLPPRDVLKPDLASDSDEYRRRPERSVHKSHRMEVFKSSDDLRQESERPVCPELARGEQDGVQRGRGGWQGQDGESMALRVARGGSREWRGREK